MVCSIENGKPSFKDSTTYVSSFLVDGNYTLSGTLPSNPAALIYVFEIKRVDFDSYVDTDFVIQYVETDIASEIHNATNKTTPVDADEFGIWESITGVLNKVSWANIKATLGAGLAFLSSAITIKGSSTGKTALASANASANDYTATFPAKSITVAGLSDIINNYDCTVGTDGDYAEPADAIAAGKTRMKFLSNVSATKTTTCPTFCIIDLNGYTFTITGQVLTLSSRTKINGNIIGNLTIANASVILNEVILTGTLSISGDYVIVNNCDISSTFTLSSGAEYCRIVHNRIRVGSITDNSGNLTNLIRDNI